MLIRLISALMFVLGGVFSFGAYTSIWGGTQIKTISFVLIPLAHFFAGFGLLRLKSWARYWTFSIAFFYLCLGFLDFRDVLSIIDFIPIVPLVEYLPISFLRWNPSIVLVVSLFIFPLFVMVCLSLKRVAVKFESWLGGNLSWSAPSGVVLAAAFIFSYAFLANSQVSSFLGHEERRIFGFSLAPFYGQFLRYAEFCLPVILAFSLVSSGRLVWCLTLGFALYYWLPTLLNNGQLYYPNQFSFLFFGIGWFLVASVLLLHWRFFLQQAGWLERQTAPKPSVDEPFVLGDELQEKSSQNVFRTVVQNRVYLILISLLIGGVIFGTVFYFWGGRESQTIQKIRAESVLTGPIFRLEGSSIDRQGAYAIINGNVVKGGAVIQGYRVEAIEAHRVLFSKDGKRYWLDDEGHFRLTGDDSPLQNF